MKKTTLVFAALSSLLWAACSKGAEPIDVSGLSEASMNFDQEGVRPFLLRLSTAVGGNFNGAAAEKVTEAIDALGLDEETSWEFEVTVAGSAQRLVIAAYKDDLDAPDLAFYTTPELAVQIQKDLESFAADRGW